MANRRNVLIGLGGLVAAGGAALGTGAFTTVTAERTVNIQTEGDASAFLALEAADRADDSTSSPGNASSGANQNEYVEETNGTIVINLDGGSDGDEDDDGDGLNQNAITTFRNLVTITNNGSQIVDSLTLEIQPDSDNVSDGTFSFTIEDSDSRGTIDNGSEILGQQTIVNELTPGTSIDFGLVIDLINGGSTSTGESGDLPTTTYTLTITAQTADSTNASS